MKHNIGSKQAAALAKIKFGDKAFAARSGKTFYVGVWRIRFFDYLIDKIHGQGKSWAEALQSAGVEIPVAPTLIAEKEAPRQNDAMPEDTDAKTPLYGNNPSEL